MQALRFILCVLVASILLSFSVFAEDLCDPIKIYVDKNEISTGAAPVIVNSRTLAPIRPVAEACGINVGWNGETGEVTLSHGFMTASFKEGNPEMSVYNSVIDEMSKVPLEASPVIIESSTFVALRPVLEVFGTAIDWDAELRSISITSPGAVRDEPSDDISGETADKSSDATAAEDNACTYSGFRDMTDHTIIESAPHGLYGRILSDSPITSVRCRIVDTNMDYILFFDASDNITNYNVFTYFDRLICFSDAGIGDQVFEVYAANDGKEEQLLFSYPYTVISKSVSEQAPADEQPTEEQPAEDVASSDGKASEETDAVTDTENDTETDEVTDTASSTATIGYYGFRKMSEDRIIAGAPHGLYGNILSDRPITSVRCRIVDTDMDYSVTIPDTDNVTEYNVFTYFDQLICFSDAGEGTQTFEIYASTDNGIEQQIFGYTYTVVSQEESITNKDPDLSSGVPVERDVCLPLEGTIKVTSPYGFRAYNRWEFHKGVDIISDSLAILSVADGVVVDCATGRNSGVGNYVAIQHEGGWVSLYYHLASYDVEIGDTVKKGQRFATMGNTGGNYGVHLHFMTCDNWYGGIWATQNNHHTPPHEYVPQLLTDVMFYNPSFEKINTDKMILCTFRFPTVTTQGSAFSISSSKAFVASENPLRSINLSITNEAGELLMSETMENPAYTKSGIYTYTGITTEFDMMCEFDKLPAGKMKVTVTAVSELGRERVIYEKNFEVIEPVNNIPVEDVVQPEAGLTPEEAAKTDAFEAGETEAMECVQEQ